MTTLKIGTRASLLARTQCGHVAEMIRERLGVDVELVEITTEGDISRAPLASLGGTGVFVSALRDALLDGRVDIAVHSLKDIPTGAAEGIALAAVPPREDPRDVLVARDGLTLGELPPGSVVATGSPRRASQLAALGLGLEIVGLRGNIDTRLGKVSSGEVDAVVLARAGLSRIDRLGLVTETIDPIQMLPAPGQGALAVECRSEDADLASRLQEHIEDPHTRAAVSAERAVLSTLEAGCSAPVGALAEVADGGEDGSEIWVRAVALSHDGTIDIRRSASGPLSDAVGVGTRLATGMLEEGAAELIDTPARRQQA
ncbi:hydroxymethylbilane synthase [Nocardioides sp. JQ2195]|uniref:hydroxymethylbilane synthase n=1 Tax=Nocardioides sp. JQ2195 TaxID=2592334 RepID=UPI00143EE787|nr:hydroxymethylbilane synthase [Nocardioides sp. JQ2195]QIX28151.1 hydroxymethylbilane synthase [Nocardioides sp. JQ2195]